jgi:hypothetical protein
MILFGQAMVSGELLIVEIISSNTKTSFVRKAENGVPHGNAFKRHNRKHAVKIHGKNVIRRDYIKK